MTVQLPQGRRSSGTGWSELELGGRDPATAWSEVPPFSSFDPRTISDCTAWYRSDLGVTTVSGNVSAWACQVTGDSNKDFVQATALSRPIYTTSDANWGGLPSLSSTGSQRMTTGVWGVALPSVATYIAIGRMTSAAGAAAREFLDTSGGRQIVYGAVTTGIVQSFSSTPLSAGIAWLGNKRIVAVGANSTATTIHVDDSVTARVTGNQGSLTSPTGLILGFATDASTWIGEWMELIIFRRLLTAAERGQIFAYAGGRYGQAWA